MPDQRYAIHGRYAAATVQKRLDERRAAYACRSIGPAVNRRARAPGGDPPPVPSGTGGGQIVGETAPEGAERVLVQQD